MSDTSRRAGVLCMCFITLLPGFGQASSGFLHRSGPDVGEDSFLSEFAGILGQGSRARISGFQTQLRPMFTALPKSNDGTLTPAVSRYALHRLFVHQHGWYVNGLEPSGNSSNASSPTDFLKDRVPSNILALVDQHLEGRGFGLQELAVLAATLDGLVHSEAVERLMKAYAVHGVPFQSSTTREMADVILQTYMLFTLLPNFSRNKLQNITSKQYLQVFPQLHKVYRNWDDTILWARDVQMNFEYGGRMERNPFQRGETQGIVSAFVVRVVEEIGAQFARFQDLECRTMKWDMLDAEDGEDGRVSLSSFHRNQPIWGWSKEGADYLREVGALDESDPQVPSVIIPNYLSIRPNCFATSTLYSVCCIDECETLMMQLESKIAAPSGASQEILSFISTTSSDTVDSPRNLSETLRGRLIDIATQHGGKVLLHSRLFAQWMHHAYPHECPYPQAPGAKRTPRTLDEWTGNRHTHASEEEKERTTKMVDVSSSDESAAPALPWSDEEELVMVLEPTNANRCWVWNAVRNFACLALVLSAWGDFRQASKKVLSGLSLFGEGPPVPKMRNSHLV